MLGRPLPPPPLEARLHGGRHSARRDAAAIQHHYDVGNDFYRLVLGPAMTYSCARFVDDTTDLATAQALKHDLICRKLGLDAMTGGRLLDVGCGWGSMVIHAATHYDVTAVGITISEAQAARARQRVAEAGVADRVEIRLQDYRDIGGQEYDAISSIGMSEHVGHQNLDRYYGLLRGALRPEGRLLNHAISKVGGSKIGRTSFIGRYVFPDGELIDVGESVLSMERAGFEVRDVESLREHYARTLRAWVANLEERWDEAVALVGVERARVWRLYMAGSAMAFADGEIAIHQVLGVVPTAIGRQRHAADPRLLRADAPSDADPAERSGRHDLGDVGGVDVLVEAGDVAVGDAHDDARRHLDALAGAVGGHEDVLLHEAVVGGRAADLGVGHALQVLRDPRQRAERCRRATA